MVSLEKQLKKLEEEKNQIMERIDERNSKRKIECRACESAHQIKDLELIQTQEYVKPSGCTDGDYYIDGEMQYICPKTRIINRILFDNSDVEWEERKKYENNPEKQFKRMYSSLFEEISEETTVVENKSVINYFVDQNRKKFGLVERKT